MLNKREVLLLYRNIDKSARRILKLYHRMQSGMPFTFVALPVAADSFILASNLESIGMCMRALDLCCGVDIHECNVGYFLYRNLNDLTLKAYRSYELLQMYRFDFTHRSKTDFEHLVQGLTELITVIASNICLYTIILDSNSSNSSARKGWKIPASTDVEDDLYEFGDGLDVLANIDTSDILEITRCDD